MTISKEAQHLLDRHILAFSRRLPFSSRKDIVNELRSSILDALEETVGDNEVREEHMRSVLEELGAPGRLAGSYTTEQFIIGPDIFPLFKLVFTIVAIVVAVTSMIQIGISLSSWNALEILIQTAELITSLVTALGFLIIVFFFILQSPLYYFRKLHLVSLLFAIFRLELYTASIFPSPNRPHILNNLP